MNDHEDVLLDQLQPGDMLRWWNDRMGMEYVLVIAVMKDHGDRRHPYDMGDRILCMGRSFGLEWKDEFELLDCTLVARQGMIQGC